MATPGQQAAAALQSGGVTRFADTNPNQDDGVQLANFLTTIIKKSAKGAAREGTIVPEPPTERLLPEGQTTESVQEKLAPQMLSPEGQQRFEAAELTRVQLSQRQQSGKSKAVLQSLSW